MLDLISGEARCPFPLGHLDRATWFYDMGDCADAGTDDRARWCWLAAEAQRVCGKRAESAAEARERRARRAMRWPRRLTA